VRLISTDAEQSHDVNPQERAEDRRSHAIAAEIQAAAFLHKIQNIMQLGNVFGVGERILRQKSFQGMQAPARLRKSSLAGVQDGKPQVFPFHSGTILRGDGVNELDRFGVIKRTPRGATHVLN